MSNLSRRAVLRSASCLIPLCIPTRALAESSSPETATIAKQKRDLVRGANEQWAADHEKLLRAAREAERRGEFSSLAPPSALVPFKDWDFYYTRGISTWRPNEGDKYEPVDVPDGFVTDLASIPQIIWSFGLRPEGPYAYAAVVHDFLYWSQTRSREESDQIFLIAMGDSKVDDGLRTRIFDTIRAVGGFAWANNAKLKKGGERRLLKMLPNDFTTSWAEWKSTPGVFRE